MDCYELEQYLHEHIPLSRAMGVEVIESGEEQVKLSAPLAPNINHRDTVFGGSASAVAILAGWALLYVRLQKAGIRSRIVIQRNTVNYERPIPREFTAQSSVRGPVEWDKFVNTLKRKHRARISVTVELHCNGNKVGELQGDFVALGVPPA